jgi:hypothetical protein
VNLYVRQEADGALPPGGKEPDTLIEAFSGRLLEILRAEGRLDRAEFPHFRGAVLPLLREHAMWTGGTAWLPEGILLEAGGACWLCRGTGQERTDPGMARFRGVSVRDVDWCRRRGRRRVGNRNPPGTVRCRPAPPGGPKVFAGAVLVTECGILVVSGEGSRLAYPNRQRIDEGVAAAADCGDGRYAINVSMEHASLSPDVRLLIVGDQCSDHVLMDYGTFEGICALLPTVSYPNFAAFTAAGVEGRWRRIRAGHHRAIRTRRRIGVSRRFGVDWRRQRLHPPTVCRRTGRKA